MEAPKLVRLVISGSLETLEILSAELFEAGALGLVEEPGAVVAYPADEVEKARFEDVIDRHRDTVSEKDDEAILTVRVEPIEVDWQKAWQTELLPQKISRSFTLRPTHRPLHESDDEEQTIWFVPEASFGSGDHPTTRLAAAWIEEHVSTHSPLRCFDVGTGTGVLSLVAVRSGASSALAVDIDDVSVRSARINVALNKEEARVQVEKGSADFTSETFPLVIANINTPILLELASHLSQRLAPLGSLLLTGLLVEDIEDIETAFGAHGLRVTERSTTGDWALLILGR